MFNYKKKGNKINKLGYSIIERCIQINMDVNCY